VFLHVVLLILVEVSKCSAVTALMCADIVSTIRAWMRRAAIAIAAAPAVGRYLPLPSPLLARTLPGALGIDAGLTRSGESAYYYARRK
jgi:hypothetical protein